MIGLQEANRVRLRRLTACIGLPCRDILHAHERFHRGIDRALKLGTREVALFTEFAGCVNVNPEEG